jgi:hypothetical protein
MCTRKKSNGGADEAGNIMLRRRLATQRKTLAALRVGI